MEKTQQEDKTKGNFNSILNELEGRIKDIEHSKFYSDILKDLAQNGQIEMKSLNFKETWLNSHLEDIKDMETKSILGSDLTNGNFENAKTIEKTLKQDIEEIGMKRIFKIFLRANQVLKFNNTILEGGEEELKSFYERKIEEIQEQSENRVKNLTKKLEINSKKITKELSAGDEKKDQELHKLRLKVISLEKQNGFLKSRSLELEKQLSKAVSKPKKKKKKIKKKPKIEENEEISENKISTEIKNSDEEQMEEEGSQSSEKENEDKENKKLKQGEVMIISTDDFHQKKKKKRKKKKTGATAFESLLIDYTNLILRSANSSRISRKDERFYDQNFTKFLEIFLDICPKLDINKKLMKEKPEFIKNLFETTHELIKNNDRVFYSEEQEHVGKPQIFPHHFRTKNKYWLTFIPKEEKGIKAINRKAQKRFEETPNEYKFLVQRSVRDQLKVLLINFVNYCRVQLMELREKVEEIQHMEFKEKTYLKGKDIRLGMKGMRDNLRMRRLYTKIMILGYEIIKNTSNLNEDEEEYFNGEIRELVAEESWKVFKEVGNEMRGWVMSLGIDCDGGRRGLEEMQLIAEGEIFSEE